MTFTAPINIRGITYARQMRLDRRAHARHKTQSLVADCADLNALALALPLLHPVGYLTQDVGVQAAAQALVRRDQNNADVLDRIAMPQERVLVFRVGARQVRGNLANLFRIRAGSTHTFLRTAHLGCCHHFHRTRDLARIFNALDLVAYFLAAGHARS
jgi:hypothetical protein